MKTFIVTCDKSSWILKAFAHMANKFWKQEFTVLGFSKFPELPDNFETISMAPKQETIHTWTRDIYNVIKDCKDEFVIFGLDDYLLLEKFNWWFFDEGMTLMRENKNIGRYELGYGAHQKKNIQSINERFFKYGTEANYRISCQMSIWRTEYLLKYLNHDWTPWQFEVLGSREANKDGYEVIGTIGEYALRTIEESALSGRHPDNINVLGLRTKYIDELVDLGYIDREKIQYGMSKGDNPKQLDISLIGPKYRKYYD